MNTQHFFDLNLEWHREEMKEADSIYSYQTAHTIFKEPKKPVECSTPEVFGGDNAKYSPEELLLSSIASCHMLVYLYLCASEKIEVIAYSDKPILKMEVSQSGKGKIIEAILNPNVTVKDSSMVQMANELHEKVNSICLIANACNIPIHHRPVSVAI